MIERLKNYLTWFCMTFTATLSFLALIPLGIHGESAMEFGFPAPYWCLIAACAWVNLIHFVKPRTP